MTEVLTPTLRQGAKRGVFWVAAALFLVVIAVASLVLTGAAGESARLSPTSASPDGTMALVEVLRQQGVEVAVASTLPEATSAVSNPDSTTLVVYDPEDYLADDDKNDRLSGVAVDLVLLEPSFDALASLAPGVNSAGSPDDDPLEAACDLPAAQVGDTVSSGGESYRTTEGTVADTCLLSTSGGAEDAYSLVRLETVDGTVTVVGATDALTNGEIRAGGNAAFALRLLGENPQLVFYTPSPADLDTALDPADVTPNWLTPVILLFVLGVIVAAVWRGRRFGPLIIENLPVDVKSVETMEGRARLYERGSARLRAVDAVRMGIVSRLATRLGLPITATVEEVVGRASQVTGADARSIRSLLVDTEPDSDRQLMELSDGLADLENHVSAALRT